MSGEKDSTANHQYSIPQEGESNWHIPLNENLEKINTGIEIRDQENMRPRDPEEEFNDISPRSLWIDTS